MENFAPPREWERKRRIEKISLKCKWNACASQLLKPINLIPLFFFTVCCCCCCCHRRRRRRECRSVAYAPWTLQNVSLLKFFSPFPFPSTSPHLSCKRIMIQHVMASIFPTLATTSFSSAHHRTKRKKPPPRLTTYRCSYIALLVMISVLSIGVEWLNHFRQPAYLNCTQHSSLLRMFPTVVATSDTTSNVCSSVCSCIWKSGKQTATCDHRSLLAVPNGLVHTTQVIDLSGNALNQLPANVFLERGLVNLQRIFLVDCHLGRLFKIFLLSKVALILIRYSFSVTLFSSLFPKRFFLCYGEKIEPIWSRYF